MNAIVSNSIKMNPLAPDRLSRRTVIPSGVLGMLLFVVCGVMLFAALISARFVVSAGTHIWPPPDQPRLPLTTTTFNTLVLLASGCALFLASRSFARSERHFKTRKLLGGALLLGAFFVLFQGMEWTRLIHYGLTIRSSTYGSFFYLIIGAHAVHAVAALGLLLHAYWTLARGQLRPTRFWAGQVFWYFVVGVWPLLYVCVYLY